MLQTAWDEIERIYEIGHVDRLTIAEFKKLKDSQSSHTKKEGNLHHYCSFFLPYDKNRGQIYLGHHIKADDWIPPGGHIEPGETPSDAAVREMQEELKVEITKDMLEPFDLSVKVVGREEVGCMTHFDIWHLVHIPVQEFDFLRSEYYDARWFSVQDAVIKMKKHSNFAAIVAGIDPA